MKPNPGGQLAPEEILGRNDLIEELWDILDGRNIYMNDLRRIGKTMILRKMEAEPRKGWRVQKRDLGGIKTASEFATQIYRDSLSMLGAKKQGLRRMSDLLGQAAGTQIAGILTLPGGTVAPWKDVLTRTFADIHEEQSNGNDRIVFLWDEVPFLIENIREIEGAQTAMEILDTLRSLSQDYDSIRLLLTGSVGMHHVLEKLHKEGYNGSPLNTFERKAPGPLAHADAVDLAERLLTGANLDVPDLGITAESVATLAGDVPFYIHRLIWRSPKNKTITPELLSRTLDQELCATDDDWDLEHYRKRLRTYFPSKGDEESIIALLDGIATSKNGSLNFSEIVNIVSAASEHADKEYARRLLKLLEKDHYLSKDEQGHYSFRLKLVERWWILDRDLSKEKGGRK